MEAGARAGARAVTQQPPASPSARWVPSGHPRRASLATGHVAESTSSHEARIDATDDLTQLERWLDQAVTAASAEEALAG
jgi:hypothetical protein